MVYANIKLDDRKDIIFDSYLRRVIFDLANADNFDDEDYYPSYRNSRYPKYGFPKKNTED